MSAIATVTVKEAYQITQDLSDLTVDVGEDVSLQVVAPGTTSYTWEWRTGPDGTWATVTKNKTDTMAFNMQAKYSGRQYRCTVSNGTTTLVSAIATVTLPSDFVFTVTDTAATLVNYNGSDAVIEVPAFYNGLPVTKIGNSAFEGNTVMTSVSLPNSIEVIGAKAFKGCINLSQMTTHD